MTRPNDSGQALVEFAFSISFFLLLVMAVMDFGYMFSAKLTLQNAVRQAGRYAITGQCIEGANGCSESRLLSIETTLENNSLGMITASNLSSDVTVESCTPPTSGVCSIWVPGAGGPGDIVNIKVAYPYPFITPLIAPFFPNHAYTIKVSSAFTNESFPPGQS